jgi:hypothetical protein
MMDQHRKIGQGCAPRYVSTLLFRHKPYDDVRDKKEENQQDFGERQAGIMDRIKSLPWNQKPIRMETIDPVPSERKAYKPDQEKQNASDKASDEYPRQGFKVFSES